MTHLRENARDVRTHRFFESVYTSDNLPVVPHNNIISRFPLLGGYSPLLHKGFYDLMAPLGDVNDSNEHKIADTEYIKAFDEMLDHVNVGYVVSDYELQGDLKLVMTEGDNYLYQNRNPFPRAFFTETLLDFDDYVDPKAILDNQSRLTITGEAPREGFVVITDLHYPGWKATLNGREVPILKAGEVFRGIQIAEAGSYEIVMEYQPLWRRLVWMTPTLLILCLLIPFLGLFRKRSE